MSDDFSGQTTPLTESAIDLEKLAGLNAWGTVRDAEVRVAVCSILSALKLQARRAPTTIA